MPKGQPPLSLDEIAAFVKATGFCGSAAKKED